MQYIKIRKYGMVANDTTIYKKQKGQRCYRSMYDLQ